MPQNNTPVGVVIVKAALLAAGLGAAVFYSPLVGGVLLGFWVICEILVSIGKRA